MFEILPSVVSSVTTIWNFLALACIAVVVLIFGLTSRNLRSKESTLKTLLSKIDSVPEDQRADTIRTQLKVPNPPKDMSAKHYLEYLKEKNKFSRFLYSIIFICLISCLVLGIIFMVLYNSFMLPKEFPHAMETSIVSPLVKCYEQGAHYSTITVSKTGTQDEKRIMTDHCHDINVGFTLLPHPVMVQVCFVTKDTCGIHDTPNGWLRFDNASQGPEDLKAIVTDVQQVTSFYLKIKAVDMSLAPFTVRMDVAY